jgi:excisionase family DNA binding protein
MLTYAEAAALLKVDKRTVRRRIADGRYTAYGDGSGS